MAFLSDDEIDKRALGLRKALGIETRVNPDLITCIFKAKDRGLIKGYLRVPDLEDEAYFDPETGILAVREAVFRLANLGVPRSRFTLAHELGHVVLGHPRKRSRGPLAHRKSEMVSTVRSDEVQADKFAAAFLMPYDLANMSLDTTSFELSDRFNVSVGAAQVRLEQLLRTHRIRNGIKRPLPEAVVQFLNSTKPLR